MQPTTRGQPTEEIPKPRWIENEWYVFERRLGSHGKRYRAHIERKPSVSFLVHILPRNRRSLDRIMVWKGLNPNDRDLPKILEDSPQGNSIYVVFPWIPGRLLEEFLEEGRTNLQSPYRMSVEIALQLFNGFAHVLGRLHGKRRIIHGDLHPENLTVALEPNRLLVIDFGSAWLVERTMHREWNDGNDPHYAAPELQQPDERGKPRFADFRSDLFSASVIFYEMLTFARPYRGAGGKAWRPEYRESCALEPPSQHSPDRKRCKRPANPVFKPTVKCGSMSPF